MGIYQVKSGIQGIPVIPGRPGIKWEKGKLAFIDNYPKFSVLEKIAEDFLAAKVILTALIMMLKVVM